MRKFIIGAVALVALAVPTAAIAGVAVDASGTGHVDKGDVQSALKWNNGDFDKYAGGLTFSSGTVTKVYNNSWICQDGSTYNQPRTQVLPRRSRRPRSTAATASRSPAGTSPTSARPTCSPTLASRRSVPARASTSSCRSSHPPASRTTRSPAPRPRLASFR